MVCLQANVAVYGERSAELTRRETEIAEVLRTAYPAGVPLQVMLDRVYGVGNGNPATIFSLISKLNRKLKLMGICISNIKRTGYRLQFSEAA
jgi:DNA-binding response OmpR family regulator